MASVAIRDLKMANSGQSLVETALLLPIVFLTLALFLQLLLVVFMQMNLQRSAARVAHRLALGQPSWRAVAPEMAVYGRALRWGRPAPGRFGGRSVPLEGWKPYPGPLAATPKNCLAIADLSYQLFGDWYVRAGIKPLRLSAHAEMPCEPSIGGPR